MMEGWATDHHGARGRVHSEDEYKGSFSCRAVAPRSVTMWEAARASTDA